MRTLLVVLASLALGDAAPPPDEAAAEVAQAERLLKDAGVRVDGPALLAFFKDRTLSPEDSRRLAAAVKGLGDDDFAVREKASRDLVRAGRPALALLRPAADDPDLEVSRRARTCIAEIEQPGVSARAVAAARLLAERRPAGAVETLLAFLPFADDEPVEDAVCDALLALALKDGRADAAVADAAADPGRGRRLAAAHVLGRATVPEQRRLAHRLLADPEPVVRFRAAASLAAAGDREAVPALTALLTDGPLPLAWQAEDLLYRLAGDKPPAASAGTWDAEGRRRCRAAWDAWWKERGPDTPLARIDRQDAVLGLNVVAELDGAARAEGGRVWECGPDGKPRWEFGLNRVIDARPLPGGRLLVVQHDTGIVTERDREGKSVWEYKTVGRQAVSAQRLPNGNTLIATYNDVREVTPDGTVLYEHRLPADGMIYNAVKLRNGNIVLVRSNNQVVEMDAAGKVLVTVPVPETAGWSSVEKLPNGRYLVAVYNVGKVVEVDAAGKVLWTATVESPGHATRLRNGNTLVASIEGKRIVEFDPSGKEVWSAKTDGRPFHVYRR
jgi:HEAT repeat protein